MGVVCLVNVVARLVVSQKGDRAKHDVADGTVSARGPSPVSAGLSPRLT